MQQFSKMLVLYIIDRLKLVGWEIYKDRISTLLRKGSISCRFFTSVSWTFEESEDIRIDITYLVNPYYSDFRYIAENPSNLPFALKELIRGVGCVEDLNDIIDIINKYNVFS